MLRTRVIPCLQLLDATLVKTVKFKKPGYIGDFVNTVRIFNELEVDELCFLSIRASQRKQDPNFEILAQVANECFMPLSYGGGIRDFETAAKIFKLGFEKVVLNSAVFENPELITKLSEHFGSQSVVVSLDVKKDMFGNTKIYSHGGSMKQKDNYLEFVERVEDYGAGELLLTSIERDGTWSGYDLKLLNEISNRVNIPLIINGGAGNLNHFKEAVEHGASALAVGSMVVYQSNGMGVLVNFPDRKKLADHISFQSK